MFLFGRCFVYGQNTAEVSDSLPEGKEVMVDLCRNMKPNVLVNSLRVCTSGGTAAGCTVFGPPRVSASPDGRCI